MILEGMFLYFKENIEEIYIAVQADRGMCDSAGQEWYLKYFL